MKFDRYLRRLIPGALASVLSLVAGSVGAQESVEPQFLSNIRQVTSGFEKAGEGYFSPDSKTIVYQAVRGQYPFYQIFTQPLEGGVPKLISTGRGRTTCAYFHPDGKHILFASGHLNPDLAKIEAEERKALEEERQSGQRRRYSWAFDPYMDIFVCDLEGHNRKQLTSEYGYDAEGAYSHDGELIAYCHVEEPESESEPANPDIYVMNQDGSGKRRITSAMGYDGGPFISPDGNWIVFRTDRKKEKYLQIHVIGIDGQNEVEVTKTPESVNWGPYWHPAEPYIIWSGADHTQPARRPNYDLYLMRYEIRDGKFMPGRTFRVTDSPAADVLPVFSPDGTKLMWTSTRTDTRTSQLFIADFTLPQQ